MIWVIPLLGVLVAGGLIIWQFRDSSSPQRPPDPEHLQRAAIELHRIRRQREGAELRFYQGREAAQVKREIAEALENRR
jgi:hypothetical protein